MNKRITLLAACALMLLSGIMHAQLRGTCGFKPEPHLIQQALETRKLADAMSPEERSTAYLWIPVKFHIVSNGDGSGGVEPHKILNMLCGWNAEYKELGMQFFIADSTFNYFSNTTLFNTPKDPAADFVASAKKQKNVMNVYITSTAGESGVLAYYSSGGPSFPFDWIVIRKDQIISGTGTIEHEAGHYFTLMHTFNGWEPEYQWTKAAYGDTVKITKAPDPNNMVPVELVNKSNCKTAADFICDTPPDYNFGYGWTGPTCDFTAKVYDKNGELIAPDESNFMSYFQSCPDYHFSADQKTQVIANANVRKNLPNGNSRALKTLQGDYDINLGAFAPVYPAEPKAGDTTKVKFNAADPTITFYWNPVPGATHYIVEASFGPAIGSVKYQTGVTKNTSFKYNGTLVDKKFFSYRVYPYNPFNTCVGTTKTYTYYMDSTVPVDEPTEFGSWEVYPNPVSVNHSLNIHLNAEEKFSGQLQMVNMVGQIVHSEYLDVESGDQLIPVNIPALSSGVYTLMIQTATGRSVKKVTVQ